MKSADQITGGIVELRGELKDKTDDPRRHRVGRSGHLGNFSMNRIRELEGEIAGLDPVVEVAGIRNDRLNACPTTDDQYLTGVAPRHPTGTTAVHSVKEIAYGKNYPSCDE